MTRVTQAHIDARTGDIVAAALRVFAQKGTNAATMQDVASEAGLSAGAIYRYFANKDDLIRAVYEHAIAESRDLFEAATAGATSPLDALVRSGYAALDDSEHSGCLDLDLSIAAIRDGGVLAEVHRELNADVVARLTGLVGAAQEAGEIGRQLDTELLARVCLALVNGLRLESMDPQVAIDGRAAINLVASLLRCSASGAAAGAS